MLPDDVRLSDDARGRLEDVADPRFAGGMLSRSAASEALQVIDSLTAKLAVLSQQAEGEWRDIAEAPKDGTAVMLGYDYEGYLFTASSGYWTEHNGGGWVRQCMFQPTHFMPLPPAPGRGA
jgi:plasmid stabilization system protein ParE